jgi:DNA-binding transcriptional ArsR family regulator
LFNRYEVDWKGDGLVKGEFHTLTRAEARKLLGAMVDPDTASHLAETFAALGDPTRVRILDSLSQRELCVCDVAHLLGMTASAVSHHLRYLRALRLVKRRKEGRNVLYSLDDEHIVTLFGEGLKHVRHG